MFDIFYLTTKESEGRTWYNLRIRDTHYSTSCGNDLSVILGVLKSYVFKYKTRNRLLRALSKLEGNYKMNPVTYDMLEEYFQLHGDEYDDILRTTIEEAQLELREYEKENSPLARTKRRLNKVVIKRPITTPPEIAEEVSPPKLIGKPKVIKIKRK